MWMYTVLLCALSVMLFIFNIISIRSFFEKKTSLINLCFGFFLMGCMISYVIFLAFFTTSIVNYFDLSKEKITLKTPIYMLSSWFLCVFFFIKISKQRFVFFLYRSIFIEENEEDEEEIDLEAQITEERRKTYKKKNIDVKEVPNFVQRFTSTYFKIKPKIKKV